MTFQEALIELGIGDGADPDQVRRAYLRLLKTRKPETDNQKLGEYRVRGIPPRPAGEESFDVRFTYDLNGILEVETTIVSTGRQETLEIERSPGRMTSAQVKAAREAMKRLKLHPRDALPNTTALARADVLYVELSGPEREELGCAIGMFRAALESQDEKEFEPWRARLLTMVEALRRR